MDCSDNFDIQCQVCGGRERLTFSEMELKELIQCSRCGTARGMQKDDILRICRDAAKMTRQRL